MPRSARSGCIGLNMIDLTDKPFGRWTVLSFARSEKGKGSIWLAQCECGTEREVLGSSLRSGKSISCGCYRPNSIKHGQCVGEWSPTYSSFMAAKARCENPKNKAYRWYGEKGVRFLFTSVEELIADIGERPDGYTLDRKDGHGDYGPGNVRWLTIEDQQRNRVDNVLIEINGVSRLADGWAAHGGANAFTIRYRMRHGFCPSCAVFNPPYKACPH